MLSDDQRPEDIDIVHLPAETKGPLKHFRNFLLKDVILPEITMAALKLVVPSIHQSQLISLYPQLIISE